MPCAVGCTASGRGPPFLPCRGLNSGPRAWQWQYLSTRLSLSVSTFFFFKALDILLRLASNPWVQEHLLPQPPAELELQVHATHGTQLGLPQLQLLPQTRACSKVRSHCRLQVLDKRELILPRQPCEYLLTPGVR